MRLTKGLGHPTLLPENFGRHSGQAQREPESRHSIGLAEKRWTFYPEALSPAELADSLLLSFLVLLVFRRTELQLEIVLVLLLQLWIGGSTVQVT